MSFIKASGHLEIGSGGGSSSYTVGGGGGGGNGSLGSGASGGSGGGGTSPGGTGITAVGAERRETWATPTMVTTLKIGALPREPEKFAQLKYNIVKLHKHLRQLVKSSEELSKAREDLYMKEQQWIMDMVDFNVHHGIEAGYATTTLTNALKQVSKARYRDAMDVRSQVMTTLKNFLNGDVAEAMQMIRNLEAARERFENASSKFSSISSSTNVGKFTKLETEVAESKQHYESTYNTAVLKLIEADSKKMNTVLEQYYNFYASFLTFAKEEEAIFRSLEPEMKTWKETFENNKSLGAEEDTLIYEQVQLQHDTVEGIGNGEPSKANTEKKGYIFKKNAKGWKCSWFVLQKGILVHYRSFKDPEPEGSLSLLLCTVKEVPSEKSFCFEVISPEERMLLRATNAEEYAEWIKVLQHSIALQLTDSGREDESDYFGGGTGGAHITSASGLVAMLREVAGNHACADCQQQDPEWAVLNMGILICVRCSGIHRGLGVHVSKVRSLALDKWERQQIEVMKLIGNKRANETLWERKVPEEWQTKRATPDGENKAVEAWIKTKYVAKSFMVKASGTADELGQRLWAATRAKDYVEVLRLIASGADPNWPNQEEEHRTILHAILSYNNDMVDGENNNTNNSFTSSNSASAAVALELLLQNGGDINAKDDKGRTPLHYCALYGQVECAKVLWNKGAKLCKDGEGRSPTEVAEAHGQEVCAALMKSFEGEISQGEEMKRRSNTTGAGTEGLLELGVANSGSNSRMGKDLRKKRNKTLSTSSGSALAASLSGVGGGSQLFFDKTFASSSSSISTSPSASNVSSPSAGSSPSLLPSSGSGSGGGGSSTKPHLLSKIKGVTLRKKKGMISPYVQAAMAAGDGINSGSPGERSPGEESSSSLSELNNIHSSTPSSTVTIITPEATGTMESLTRTARALSEEEPASSSLSDCPASSPSGGRHKKRGISIHQSLRRHRVHSGDAILHHPSSSLSTDASASLPTSALGGIDSDTDTDIAYVNNRGELVLDGRSTSDAEDEFLTGGGVHDEEGEESFSNESSHSASPSLPLPPATATKRNKNSSPRWSRATKPATWTKKAPIPSIMKSPRRTPSFEPKEQTKKKAETDASDQTTDSGSESSKEQKHKKKKKVKRKGSGGSEGVEKETSTPFPGIRHHDLTSSLLQLDTSPLSFDVDPSDATAPKNHKKKEKRTKRKGEKDKSDSSKRKSLAPTSATATALHHVLVGPELGNSPLQLRRTVSQPSEVHAKIVTSSPPASSSSKPTISSKLAWRRSKEIKNNEGGGTSSGEGEGRRPTANGEEPMLGAERRREEPMEQQPPEDSG